MANGLKQNEMAEGTIFHRPIGSIPILRGTETGGLMACRTIGS